MQEPRLLTLNQAAETLQVSRATLYRLLNEGSLPSVYIRGSRRIANVDIESFIAGLPAEAREVRS